VVLPLYILRSYFSCLKWLCTHTQAINYIRDVWSFLSMCYEVLILGRFIFSFLCDVFNDTPSLSNIDARWMNMNMEHGLNGNWGQKTEVLWNPTWTTLELYLGLYSQKLVTVWSMAQPAFIIEFLYFSGLFGEMSCVCMAIGVHFVSLFLWLWFFFSYENQTDSVALCLHVHTFMVKADCPRLLFSNNGCWYNALQTALHYNKYNIRFYCPYNFIINVKNI
jgi:hypothetical protein